MCMQQVDCEDDSHHSLQFPDVHKLSEIAVKYQLSQEHQKTFSFIVFSLNDEGLATVNL